MKLYRKLIIPIFIFAMIIATGKVIQSRFWDTERVEKSVRSEVPIGSTKKFVVEWLSKSDIDVQHVTPANSKMWQEDTGLTAKQLQIVVIGTTKEGYPLADLYNINVYFFFDKNKRLIKYNFSKVWAGM
ncbi:MAG: hypothetical protein ABI210_10065 [Abditibacteriaceae bacterium]